MAKSASESRKRVRLDWGTEQTEVIVCNGFDYAFFMALWGNFHYGNETDLRIRELRRSVHVLEERLE